MNTPPPAVFATAIGGAGMVAAAVYDLSPLRALLMAVIATAVVAVDVRLAKHTDDEEAGR